MTDKSETIEEWAARKALTLDADGWRRHERQASPDSPAFPGCPADAACVAQSRALLAYRDKVAKSLSKGQRDVLCEAARSHYGKSTWTDVEAWGGERLSARALDRKGLLRSAHPGGPAWNEWRITPFGREVARVLEISRG